MSPERLRWSLEKFTAVRFTRRPVDAGIAPSTGSVGDSVDWPSREPVVDPQDRADLLARNHFRHQSRSGGSVVPLNRPKYNPRRRSSRPPWREYRWALRAH